MTDDCNEKDENLDSFDSLLSAVDGFVVAEAPVMQVNLGKSLLAPPLPTAEQCCGVRAHKSNEKPR